MSNDGRWLGYSVEGGGSSQVKRVRRGEAGAVPEPVTSDTAGSYWTAWSPDAKEIAFHRFNGEYSDVVYATINSVTVQAAPVPEPSTYAMLAAGLGLLGALRRRQSH